MLSSLTGSARDWIALLPRSAKLAALGFLVLLVAVVGYRAATGGSTAAARAGGAPTARPAPGGDGARMLRADGDAVLGVLRSTDGAAAAALSYVQQRNGLLTGGTTSRQAAEVGSTIALGGHDVGQDPASIPDRAAASDGDAMLRTRAGQTTWWTVPFGYRVRSYAQGGRATVRVYSGLLSADVDPARGPAVFALALVDVGLSWRDDAWRIRSVDEARDQPGAAAAVAIDTSTAAASLPVRDRVIRASTQNGSPLYRFLAQARPIVSGPLGMGPVDRTAPLDEDAAAIQRDASEGTAGQARALGILDGGRKGDWRTGTPLATRQVACPQNTADTRCYEGLVVGIGTTGGGGATVQFGLVGYALTGTGPSLAVRKLELSVEAQSAVLGGQVTIASSEDDRRRTTLAAWRRSIVPLRPVIPGTPR